MKIAVVIPAFNEGQVLGTVLRDARRRLPRKYHLVVVNDGSQDDTGKLAEHYADVVLHHPINFGSGAATETGLEFARRNGFDGVVTMDADGQHEISDVARVGRELEQRSADLVIGSRLVNTAGMPWYRILGNRLLNLVTYVVLGVHVTDSQSGLKGFSKKALHAIRIQSASFEFCSEIVWRAHRAGLAVKEIPIKAIYTDYSLAKGQRNVDALKLTKNLVKRKLFDPHGA